MIKMSAPNFYTMENFSLFVKVYEAMTLEEYQEEEFHYDDYLYPEYEEAEDEDKADILEKSYNHAMDLWSEDFYRDIFYGYDGFKEVMENFNNDLIFHKIEIKSGYYDGVQLYVDELENPHELDNDDCRYYYDMCRSQAIRKYDAEIRKINKWMEKVATEYGWRKLNCLGVFSNGEAIYQYA
jgi:hypothetical protein